MRLHHRATLSGEKFAALSAHYDDAKIFEIILLCGFYRTGVVSRQRARSGAGANGSAVSTGVVWRVPDAVRHSSCRSAEPGPYRAPRFFTTPGLAAHHAAKGGALPSIRGTEA